MLVTDAQVHIWTAESPERPWGPAAERFAHGPSFSADRLLAGMDTAGVDRAVLVPPSFAGDRNEDCLTAAARHPDRFRVMGRVDLSSRKSRAWVAGWRERDGLLGVRLTFGRGASAGWLRDGTADWFWPAAADRGMPVMVYAPGQLAEVAAIARSYPHLGISLCHFSLRPEQADGEIIARVISELIPLAAYPNVSVKATGLPGNASDEYPFLSLHQHVRRVVNAFGPHRVFWGSDITRLSCTYREAVTMFTEELDFLDDEDSEWVMGRALSEWIGWP